LKEPGSAAAISRATDGFSAMTSVFDTRDTLPKGSNDAPRTAHTGTGTSRAVEILRAVGVTPLYFVAGAVSWPLMRLVFRLRALGLSNLPDGGFVLAANHTSSLDPWPLGFPLWPRRQLHFMAKVELFNPILGPLLHGAGAFPVRRGERDVQAIETAVRLCREGKIVAMFPEGTRREKGLRKKFEHRPRTGAARIALAAGVPLVPAAIEGTDRLSRLPRLRILYGEPVPIDDLAGAPPREAAQEATDRLMEHIYELHAAL
jgi:1-acyl-sn-glycerol-3-phosphate acyltransferase